MRWNRVNVEFLNIIFESRARAAGAVAFVLACSTNKTRFVQEYNARLGIHVTNDTVFTFPYILCSCSLARGAGLRARVKLPMASSVNYKAYLVVQYRAAVTPRLNSGSNVYAART